MIIWILRAHQFYSADHFRGKSQQKIKKIWNFEQEEEEEISISSRMNLIRNFLK